MRLIDMQWSEFAMHLKRGCIFFLVVFFACSKEKENKLYTAIKSNESGILFTNTITISDSLVLPGYEYIYNGGGVGVIDVNNDGYQDLFFSGNLISSKLYLNKGGLKFEDITEKAGLITNTWVNGVSIVDINQDGFMDIYLSVGGHQFTPESERANLLYINNKNSTFTEKATSFGLNDKGYGIQSAFFDYDKDGDLDMYQLRNSFVTYPRNNARLKATNGEAPSTDKLFRNNGNNTFTDVSREANILIEGFGLGINVTDINADGWPDIYVTNDFITNDLLWINNRNGTFTNEIANYLKHQTFNGMGVDVADYNNDGLQDIIELDMLPPDNKRWKLTPRGNSYDEFQNGISKGYEPQYVRNTLQLNNGNGTFSEIGQFAGIEATDWSWSALFIDMDHDGWRDLFITNGYGRDITNLDFIVYGDQAQAMGMDAAGVKERQKLLREIPGINVYNYFFCNNRDLTFKDKSADWATNTPSFSNGAAYADLDNDGDRDLITNNIDEPASIWQSNLMNSPDGTNNHFIRLKFNGPYSNRNGIGVKVILKSKGIFTNEIFSPYRGYLSTMEPYLHFGIGPATVVDSLIVIWPDGKQEIIQNTQANSTLTVEFSNAREMASISPSKELTLFSDVTEFIGLDYTHKENVFTDFKVQPLLPVMHSRNGPGIATGDVNGDG
ncbi:MAG: CRTAC1 family protein, partial [Saprospiraceae bacterium]|nr:CRTAC1 family protein [Saprospiraceae bacterium]